MIGAIILQVILIALNAVFTCAETAIVSLNDNQLEEMAKKDEAKACLLYTSPSPRDSWRSRMPSSA